MKITKRQLVNILIEESGLSDNQVKRINLKRQFFPAVERLIDKAVGRIDDEIDPYEPLAKVDILDELVPYLASLNRQLSGFNESKITRKNLRKIILEELEKLPSYAYYDYGIDYVPNKTDAHEDIIGHTWATHVKRKGSALNEIGEVVWHSLDNNGNINFYDVEWGNGLVEHNIPADSLIEIANSDILPEAHESHGFQGEDTPILERKRKRKKKSKANKAKKKMTNKLRWYFGYGGNDYHHDSDFEDFGFDIGGDVGGDGGGGE